MLPQLQTISIFLASPGDAGEERATVSRIVDELNPSLFNKRQLLRVVKWETHAVPEYGIDPQSAINKQIADMTDFQLFVGIVKNRIGTPTPRADSGTLEELDRAEKCRRTTGFPHIMIYFGERASVTDGDAARQQKLVEEFEKRLRKEGLFWSFKGIRDFENLFRNHLQLWLSQQKWGTATPSEACASDGNWLLLDGHFFQCESVSDDGKDAITAVIVDPKAEEEAVLRGYQARGCKVSSVIAFFAP